MKIVTLNEDGRQCVSVPYRVLRKQIFDDRDVDVLQGDLERLLYDRARRL
jgi:hypothetical protein